MLTVSIVTFHTAEQELRSALDCLANPDVGHIWVIDNGHEERIRKICGDYPKVEYIASENVGYGSANNIALRKALEMPEAKYHLVMNTDLSFDPAILRQLSDKLDRNPEIGCIQPRIVSPNGDQQNPRKLPTPLDLLARSIFPRTWFRKSRDRYLLRHLDLDQPWNVPFHSGCFMFLRLDALRKVGLFDERFFLYMEDIDLSRRIHRDYVSLYWPEVSINHSHRAASKKHPKLFLIHAFTIIKYFNKWGWWKDAERKRFNENIEKGPYVTADSVSRG